MLPTEYLRYLLTATSVGKNSVSRWRLNSPLPSNFVGLFLGSLFFVVFSLSLFLSRVKNSLNILATKSRPLPTRTSARYCQPVLKQPRVACPVRDDGSVRLPKQIPIRA